MTDQRMRAGTARGEDLTPPIIEPGRNCWRVARAERVAFLIDASRYFDVLDRSLPLARRRITIVGWDFDSATRLRPGGPALGERLVELVDNNPTLEIQVLVWRSSLVYSHNRDIPLPLPGKWWEHPRIRYQLDAAHPLGGSHHQKLICIDDRLAFAGGIDLTDERWDECGHRAHSAQRCSPKGGSYGPVHDVQMMVDGPAAAALADLTRARWSRASGEELAPVEDGVLLWPQGVAADLRGHDIAIARTRPDYDGQGEVREIEQLNLDALAAARRNIYIEAQYFALPAVAELLCDHLRRADGPEIAAVVNYNSHGRLEQYVMGQNRDRLFAHLRGSDEHGRLALLYSRAASDPECNVKIHSKVVIVDDRFLRIGSSNFNQRSLGVDSECDLALEAVTPRAQAAVRRFRRDLLADHLRVSPARVAQVWRANGGSLLRTLERLRGEGCLCDYEVDPTDAAPPVPLTDVLDPAEPFSLERVLGLKG